ncbi:MAG: PAS domain-containing protein [Candidatus Saganbacteria bacterium]|nr:PAS domain-containing protein [Candidatus Saganbacteria bacterium]
MKKKKGGLIAELQKKHEEILNSFNKLQETFAIQTIEKLRAQEELRFLQEYSHHIIESAGDGIVTCDTEYRLTSFSPAAQRLLFYRSQEILGNLLHEFFEKPEEFIELNERIIKDGYARNFETTLIDKNKKAVPVMLSFSYLEGPRKNPIGLVGVIRDLREIKNLQSQLVQSGKLAAIGQLAAGVAHEINNPLTIALSNIQFILPRVNSRETRKVLNIILKELMRCTDVTQGLLSFSRETSKRTIEALNINECIESVFFVLKYKLKISKIKLIKRFAKKLPRVMGDANQLQQVFLNLVLNAIDAMPKGGHLYIRTSAENKKFVRATVADTGIGISAEDLLHVFEPFYTTKEPGRGVGLGLSISYGIIKDHAGEIQIKSQFAKNHKRGNTTFTIKLPVCVRGAARPNLKKRK